jgi:hypothetical protein
VTNPLGFSAAEVDAIRDLQAGVYRIDANDPIWDGLVEVGLVDPASLPDKRPELAIRGPGYRTG